MPDARQRDALRRLLEREIDTLVGGLTSGLLTPVAWHNEMLAQLADYHTAAYLAGRGEQVLDAGGRTFVARQVAAQAPFLERFSLALETEDLSDASIRQRASLYAGSLTTTYEVAQTWVHDLPFYPGDGGTPCKGGCHCHWEQRGDVWWWRLGPVRTEHCSGCLARAQGSPYVG